MIAYTSDRISWTIFASSTVRIGPYIDTVISEFDSPAYEGGNSRKTLHSQRLLGAGNLDFEDLVYQGFGTHHSSTFYVIESSGDHMLQWKLHAYNRPGVSLFRLSWIFHFHRCHGKLSGALDQGFPPLRFNFFCKTNSRDSIHKSWPAKYIKISLFPPFHFSFFHSPLYIRYTYHLLWSLWP